MADVAAVPWAPERSAAQRASALERANEVRLYRAELKRRLRRGQVVAREVVMAPSAELETMKVSELLLAVPKYGRVKVNKMLMRAKVSPSRTLGGLSEAQRRELAMLLPARVRLSVAAVR